MNDATNAAVSWRDAACLLQNAKQTLTLGLATTMHGTAV